MRHTPRHAVRVCSAQGGRTRRDAGCCASTLPWLATSDAEHAVSYEAHGPCSLSANETRPHVTEHEEPVNAYTLRPAGIPSSTLPNSLSR